MWLARSRAGSTDSTPFPSRQLFILAICRICEPIAFMSVFPYIYYMVKSFNVTDDERWIAIYAGMVTSSFAFAEFATGVLWGRLSDRIGRKPVLIFGLAGTALSMLTFGFATSLPMAILARGLGGFLNGNIGVLQTTVAEMITVKEHQPRAYAIMPFIWCLGSIIGPALGGALADPCANYPTVFARGTILDRYPYLLPNLICTAILVCGVTVGILFLEETHEQKKYRSDVGVDAGRWLLDRIGRRQADAFTPQTFSKADEANLPECQTLLGDDEQPPGHRSADASPRPSSSGSCVDECRKRSCPSEPSRIRRPPSVEKVFTRQVVLNIIGYGLLAYHTMTFEHLMPVMLSSPDTGEAASSPFKFTGGFALPTKAIGVIMSCQGLYSMVAQLFLFPVVVRRFGSLAVFRTVALVYPLLYFVAPYLVLLPPRMRMLGLSVCLLFKVTGQVLAYPSNAIQLTNSASSMLVLGTINGVAASTASLSRAFGPTISGLVHSVGLKWGYSGLAWWSSALICIVAAAECLLMEEGSGRFDHVDPVDEEAGAEPEVSSDPETATATATATPAHDAATEPAVDLERPFEMVDASLMTATRKPAMVLPPRG